MSAAAEQTAISAPREWLVHEQIPLRGGLIIPRPTYIDGSKALIDLVEAVATPEVSANSDAPLCSARLPVRRHGQVLILEGELANLEMRRALARWHQSNVGAAMRIRGVSYHHSLSPLFKWHGSPVQEGVECLLLPDMNYHFLQEFLDSIEDIALVIIDGLASFIDGGPLPVPHSRDGKFLDLRMDRLGRTVGCAVVAYP